MAKKLWDNEKELAKVVVDHLKKEGWTIYPEIYDIDIVAKKPDASCLNGFKIIGIECKLHFNLRVLAQGTRKRRYVDEMYIAVSDGYDNDEHFGCDVARKFGLGAYFVQKEKVPASVWRMHEGLVKFYGDAYKDEPTNQYYIRKRLEAVYQKRVGDIDGMLDPEAETFAEAGQAGGKSWSAFKRTSLRIKEYVEENPGKTLKQVLQVVPHHYSNLSSAQSALRKLIKDRIVEGVEFRDKLLYPITSPTK